MEVLCTGRTIPSVKIPYPSRNKALCSVVPSLVADCATMSHHVALHAIICATWWATLQLDPNDIMSTYGCVQYDDDPGSVVLTVQHPWLRTIQTTTALFMHRISSSSDVSNVFFKTSGWLHHKMTVSYNWSFTKFCDCRIKRLISFARKAYAII